VERSSGTTSVWTVIASNLAATATSYVDNSVTAGATYSYEVEAFNGTAGSPYTNVASATVPYATPAAPTNLIATASALSASVSLSWTDDGSNATSYTVERSSGTTGVWSVIASNLSATATSYVDRSVTAGATYRYEVEAFNGTAGSPYSNVAWATVPSAGLAAPTNLTATAAASPLSITLSWTDNATSATSYVVDRSVDMTGVWTVIVNDLPGTATSYIDGQVERGVTYSYRVEAVAGRVASPYSNVASAGISTAVEGGPMAGTATPTSTVASGSMPAGDGGSGDSSAAPEASPGYPASATAAAPEWPGLPRHPSNQLASAKDIDAALGQVGEILGQQDRLDAVLGLIPDGQSMRAVSAKRAHRP
jgi:hypothetical protein